MEVQLIPLLTTIINIMFNRFGEPGQRSIRQGCVQIPTPCVCLWGRVCVRAWSSGVDRLPPHDSRAECRLPTGPVP